MNNISLVISGNLTGFSRFYTSPTANDILNDAKFDFDYRNFLTFLNRGDKAYAISFAPRVLAVSLVTRILDSFRRPGILVVTLLLPRRSKVESAVGMPNNNALYQLLNEINDKFYERNFINGMVNQNAAVLMQDYYTEIIGKYVLVSDGMQRNINSTIDVTSPNKRLGYVQTMENNVPLYLSSLCRRSYEGCHHVFFAQNPTNNLIAEEPVEVVFYQVRITNNNQSISSVRLSDQIFNLRPSEGEIDINKNYTYQQVLNGEAGRDIVAELRGEVIEMTYRFGLEEKTIKFVFTERGKIIPFTTIMPMLEHNGFSINVPSETYTFQGKEIYGFKTLKSRSDEYRIKEGSQTLDLRRVQDTCNIEVEHCFPVRIPFPNPYNREKTIVFNGNSGPYRYHVTDLLETTLPGYQEDYNYSIESDYYETFSGTFPPPGVRIQIPLKLKSNNSRQNHQGGSLNNFQAQSGRAGSNAGGHGGRVSSQNSKTYAHSTANQSGGAIQLNGGDTRQDRKTESQNNRYIIPIVSSVLCVVIGYFIMASFFDLPPFSETTKEHQDIVKNGAYNYTIHVSFIDSDSDVVVSDNISYDVFSKHVKTTITPEFSCEMISENKKGVLSIDYHIFGDTSEVKKLDFVVTLNGVVINEEMSINTNSEIEKDQKIRLKIRTSDIALYEILSSRSPITDKGKYQERIDDIQVPELKEKLQSLLNNIHPSNVDEDNKGDAEKFPDILSSCDVTEKDIADIEAELKKGKKFSKEDGVSVEIRIKSLKEMFNALKKGGRPSTRNLSNDQKTMIQEIWKEKEANHFEKYKIFGKIKSLSEFKGKIDNQINGQ